ncbi:c-type cytochrome biogenesis protein CcmI [Paracoccus endophyticus]|uniref:c-type cytochrome biogenesis protein CcmI n=1 Tax=Paracoccus endophyticus TaxID=2233774 RepID=UPI000DD8BA90|nr:c-type cytochrome biogenesis protein CcmI [Paracoccus endophyticus]
MFWVMAAAMTVLVAVALLLPFLRGGRVAEPAAAFDLRVYRDQLREVDRDLSRGVLTPDEADRLRTEIGRKVLEADRALAAQSPRTVTAGRGAVAIALLAVLLGGAGALYAWLGAPRLPDAPLTVRVAAAEARYNGRPTQAEAERTAPPISVATPDPAYVELIDKLREAVARNPGDPQGLALLAEHELRLGNLVAARTAQSQLVESLGDRAGALDHARLAALMVEAAGGLVTPEAEAALDRALALDPQNGQALYMRGLMLAQTDRPDLAFPIWRGLLERGPEDAPWIAPIRQVIPDLAWLAGHADYQPPPAGGAAEGAAPAMPGPDAAAVAAAQDMTPEERQQMIAGMVRQLEDRLTTTGGTGAEWGRLVGALTVTGQMDKARAMLDQGRAALQGDAAELAALNDAATGAGL